MPMHMSMQGCTRIMRCSCAPTVAHRQSRHCRCGTTCIPAGIRTPAGGHLRPAKLLLVRAVEAEVGPGRLPLQVEANALPEKQRDHAFALDRDLLRRGHGHLVVAPLREEDAHE